MEVTIKRKSSDSLKTPSNSEPLSKKLKLSIVTSKISQPTKTPEEVVSSLLKSQSITLKRIKTGSNEKSVNPKANSLEVINKAFPLKSKDDPLTIHKFKIVNPMEIINKNFPLIKKDSKAKVTQKAKVKRKKKEKFSKPATNVCYEEEICINNTKYVIREVGNVQKMKSVDLKFLN